MNGVRLSLLDYWVGNGFLVLFCALAALGQACQPADATPSLTSTVVVPPTIRVDVTSTVVSRPTIPSLPPLTPTAILMPTPVPPSPIPVPRLRRGSVLRGAVANDWVSMDPMVATTSSPERHMIFDPLFYWRLKPDGVWGPAPGLVDSWEAGNGSLTLRLHSDVKFHDASEWNSTVAKWNLDRLVSNPRSRLKPVLADIQSVEVVDRYTVRINQQAPDASILARLSSGQPMPPYMISKTAVERYGEDDFGRKTPVGSGPMQFVEWKPADHVSVKRWDGYWQRGSDGQPLPYLDGVYYRLIIDDAVRLLEVRAGSVDFTENVPARDLASLRTSPDFIYTEGAWMGSQYRLAFNASSPVFKDAQKRRALLLAIDREAIARSLGSGTGSAARYVLAPGTLGYDNSLSYWWYAREVAKEALRDASAEPLSITLLSVTRQTDRLQADLLKQMWEAIGVRVAVEAVEPLVHNQRTSQSRTYEVASVRNPLYSSPNATFERHYSSRGADNYTGFADPAMDQCIAEGRSSFVEKARFDAYRRCQRMAWESAWFAPIWNQPWNWVASRQLQGILPSWGANWELREAWIAR